MTLEALKHRVKTSDDVKERRIRNPYKVDENILNELHSVCLELEKISGIDITTAHFSRNM